MTIQYIHSLTRIKHFHRLALLTIYATHSPSLSLTHIHAQFASSTQFQYSRPSSKSINWKILCHFWLFSIVASTAFFPPVIVSQARACTTSTYNAYGMPHNQNRIRGFDELTIGSTANIHPFNHPTKSHWRNAKRNSVLILVCLLALQRFSKCLLALLLLHGFVSLEHISSRFTFSPASNYIYCARRFFFVVFRSFLATIAVVAPTVS